MKNGALYRYRLKIKSGESEFAIQFYDMIMRWHFTRIQFKNEIQWLHIFDVYKNNLERWNKHDKIY